MHWIINSTLTGEGGYYALVEQIERQGHAYTLVRKPPHRRTDVLRALSRYEDRIE